MATNVVNEEHMSPDVSPDQSSGVRKVNRVPMYILGGALTVFLVVMMLVAMDRAEKQNRPAEAAKEKGGNTSMFANQIARDFKNGLVPAKEKPLIIPEEATTPALTPPLTIIRPDNLDKPPVPPNNIDGKQQAENEEDTRIRQMKFQQFQEAIKAHTTVQVVAPRSPGSSSAETSRNNRDEVMAKLIAARQQMDTTAAYKDRIAQLQQNTGSSDEMGYGGINNNSSAPQLLSAEAANDTRSNSSRNNIDQFGNQGKSSRWKLDSQPEAPTTPYELRAGYVIPGTLISGINSELPGQIVAQVAQDVYDTPTGKYTLIPQGSRLVGSYSSDVAYGQSRVLVAWQRIIFPDGKAMDIGTMPGADSAGYSGFTDQVDNHYLRTFGSALLMSAITAGIAYSQQNTGATSTTGTIGAPTATSMMSMALGQQLGQVTAQLIRKNMNIAPTLEIRPGYRFNVIVTKDLTFSKPYQSFDY